MGGSRAGGRGLRGRPGNAFPIAGVSGEEAKNLFGLSAGLTLAKQDFWARTRSYLFNPDTESYERVSNLNMARWYPSLVTLTHGRVLAVSGLDQFGRIIEGQNELYHPATRKWSLAPQLSPDVPHLSGTVPDARRQALLLGQQRGVRLGHRGADTRHLEPDDNTFTVVPGLRDPNETETSASVLLPPAQAQRYMVIGGGGVGQFPALDEPHRHRRPAARPRLTSNRARASLSRRAIRRPSSRRTAA